MKSALAYLLLFLLSLLIFDALTLILGSSFALWTLYYFTDKQIKKKQL